MEILVKAVKFYFKTWKLMVFIGLIFFPFVILLYFLFDHLFLPLVDDNFTQISSTQEIDLTSLSSLVITEAILIILYYLIVYFFFSIAIISLSSMSCSKKGDITMKSLVLNFRCKRWKGPIITYICNTTLIWGFQVICFTYTPKINVSTIWVILGLVLGYVGIYVLFLGFVISVVEDDCYGLQPLIGRTTDVLKEKGVQLLAVIPIRFIGSWVLALIYEVLIDTNMEGSQFLGRVLLALGNIVIEMFIAVVCVVCYFEIVENTIEDQVGDEI